MFLLTAWCPHILDGVETIYHLMKFTKEYQIQFNLEISLINSSKNKIIEI